MPMTFDKVTQLQYMNQIFNRTVTQLFKQPISHLYPLSVHVVTFNFKVHNQTPHGQVHRMHRRTDNIQPHTGIRLGMHADK